MEAPAGRRQRWPRRGKAPRPQSKKRESQKINRHRKRSPCARITSTWDAPVRRAMNSRIGLPPSVSWSMRMARSTRPAATAKSVRMANRGASQRRKRQERSFRRNGAPHRDLRYFSLLSLHGRFGYSHVLIRCTVVEEPALALARHSFNKDHVRNLPDFLPFFFRTENRLIRTRKQLAGISGVKYCNSSAINQLVVSAVINQHDSAF